MQTVELLDNGVMIEETAFGEGKELDVVGEGLGPDSCFCICGCIDSTTRTAERGAILVVTAASAPQQ